MKRIICIAAAAFLFPLFSRADVVEEGQTTVKVMLKNSSAFPDYEFYILYQDYYYNMGYQKGDQLVLWLEEGREYEAGDQGSSSKIYARLISDTVQIFETESEYGGEEIVHDRKVSVLVDEITITKIEGDHVAVKVKRVKIDNKGKRSNSDEGFIMGIHKGPFQILGINGWIWLMPLAAFLSLTMLYFWRRNLGHTHARTAA